MLEIYTSLYAHSMPSDVEFDVFCPEDGLSPYGQIHWIDDNYGRDIIVFTYSVYMLSELSVLLASGRLRRADVRVWYCYSNDDGVIHRSNLISDSGFVDIMYFTDILEALYNRYLSFLDSASDVSVR